jgi:tRNA 2-thiouridine synthesizing protein A
MAVSDAADQVLDCTGMQCPLPVIKTAQAIKTLEPGQVLELLATDPGVEPDMKAWSTRTGNELLKIEKTDHVFHVFLRRA